MKITHKFYGEGQTTYVTIHYKRNNFTGIAICHPDDYDMLKSMTGYNIAESRAYVKLYQHIKDNEYKPKLEMLKHLKSLYTRGKDFNSNTYEYKMLIRQIREYEDKIKAIKEEIEAEKAYCKEYIESKEKIYQEIRNKREKDNE